MIIHVINVLKPANSCLQNASHLSKVLHHVSIILKHASDVLNHASNMIIMLAMC